LKIIDYYRYFLESDQTLLDPKIRLGVSDEEYIDPVSCRTDFPRNVEELLRDPLARPMKLSKHFEPLKQTFKVLGFRLTFITIRATPADPQSKAIKIKRGVNFPPKTKTYDSYVK